MSLRLTVLGPMLALLLGFAVQGCGDACVRNSDCGGGLVCSAGSCMEEAEDAGSDEFLDADVPDGALPDGQVSTDGGTDGG